jgi:lysophospholipase L1-like esterase
LRFVLKRAVILCALYLALLPAAAEAAAAVPSVEVGKVRVTRPHDGRVSLLVPVRYPSEMAGRTIRARVRIVVPGARPRTYRLATRASAGAQPPPERRARFTFVHAITLNERLSRMVRRGAVPRASVVAVARLDLEGDGRAELVRRGRLGTHPVRRAGRRLCETLPQLRTRPGKRVGVALPRCGGALRRQALSADAPGRVRIRRGRLLYWPPQRFRGTATLRLSASQTVEVKVGTAQDTVVRAIGDSVTAGFGYYDDGTTMGLSELTSCEPGATFYNDACSSNSISRSNKGKKIEYAPDYGLSNNVSWAAQWSNEHGITDYKNLAVTGSEPKNWIPGGYLHKTAEQVAGEDPDYILMTMGANPLLSEMLFGIDNMGCAIESDVLGGYRECIEEAFAGVNLRADLKTLYEELVAGTDATIFLMQYHLSVPSSALAYTSTQIAEMGALLNREIASVAGEVNPQRLRVVTPPHFSVGVDISPVYPSRYSCSLLDFKVDGPSVQSTLTQDELTISHPLSFCSGPPSGPPWVISGDTGIHPSAAGYTQMASQVPAPVG